MHTVPGLPRLPERPAETLIPLRLEISRLDRNLHRFTRELWYLSECKETIPAELLTAIEDTQEKLNRLRGVLALKLEYFGFSSA